MFSQKQTIVNSVIGENSYFNGKLSIRGTLKIDGCYEGEILDVDQIFIGPNGKVKSNIKTVSIVVEGIVIGNIVATSRVHLLSTSRVLGEIFTPELIIQNGVILEGKCRVSKDLDKNVKENIESLYNTKESNIPLNK